MSPFRIIVAIIFLFAAFSVMVVFLPVPKPLKPMANQIEDPSPTFSNFEALELLFNAATLPEKIAPEPITTPEAAPPDPAINIKRYAYIGLAASESGAAGVFERDSETYLLVPSNRLEGFILISINAKNALFANESGLEVRLPLTTMAN